MKYLVVDGGEVEVKSVEGAPQVSGWGVVFGSPSQPDQMKDFFTPESFINRNDSFQVDLYLEHGQGYDEPIGTATLKKEMNGWSAIGFLDTKNDVAVKTYERMKDQKSFWGFSSGAVSHLVRREAKSNGTNHIKRWPVAELSLTERPAEKRAIVSEVKSLKCDSMEVEECEYDANGNWVCGGGSMMSMIKHLESVLDTLKKAQAGIETKTFITEADFNTKLEAAIQAKSVELEAKVDAFLKSCGDKPKDDEDMKKQLSDLKAEVESLKGLLAQKDAAIEAKQAELDTVKGEFDSYKAANDITANAAKFKELLEPITF